MQRAVVLGLAMISATAAAQMPRAPMPGPEPMRNAFLTGAETVLDDVAAVDIHGEQTAVDARMQTLHTAQGNLAAMAQNDREHRVLEAVDDVVFTLSACRIQAVDGTDSTNCMAKLERQRALAMEAMGKRKQNGAWVDAPAS